MIDLTSSASLEAFDEIALHRLLEACDALGEKVFISTEKSLNFDSGMKCWYWIREAGLPLGLISVFAPRRDEVELSALVHPARRKSGLFAALLAYAESALRPYGFADELFVSDRSSPAGAAAALALGARLDFTEYGMAYPRVAVTTAVPGAASRPLAEGLSFAEVGSERLAELIELRMDAFGDTREASESMQRAAFASARRKEYVALLGGSIVGACSVAFEAEEVSLNGIGVATRHRGKGIARALIAWIIERLADSGLQIVLDVESTNEAAFKLYSSLGFTVTRAVDYYRRPFPPPV